MFYLNSKDLLSEKQFGFTQQKSTEDALHSLTQFISKSFEKKGYCLVIAADICGAFDHMSWTKVLYELRRKKCPKNLYTLVESYFRDRKAKIWYLNREVERELTIGCPKGSASGPQY
jgi:hypothetical protein